MSMHDPYGRPHPRPEGAPGAGWIAGGLLVLLLIGGMIVWGGSSGPVNTAANAPAATTEPATTGSGAAGPRRPLATPAAPERSTTGSGATR